MDTHRFTVHVERDYIYKDITEDVDTSTFELERPIIKDELGG